MYKPTKPRRHYDENFLKKEGKIMKKLLLVCCLALVSYGCEKAPEKIEPKLKVLKFVFDDNGAAFRKRIFDAKTLMTDIWVENFKTGALHQPYVFEKSRDYYDQLQDKVSNLRGHYIYWENAYNSGCSETVSFAYDKYMKSLYNHLYNDNESVHDYDKPLGTRVKGMLELFETANKVEPSHLAIAKQNMNLILEYEKKLEENYNANLQAN